MELLRGMRRKESVGLLKKRSDLKTRDAAARKEYQELKQKWKVNVKQGLDTDTAGYSKHCIYHRPWNHWGR